LPGELAPGGIYDGDRVVLDDPIADAFVRRDVAFVVSRRTCAWLRRGDPLELVPPPPELARLCRSQVRLALGRLARLLLP
jgi:hypothetical protein